MLSVINIGLWVKKPWPLPEVGKKNVRPPPIMRNVATRLLLHGPLNKFFSRMKLKFQKKIQIFLSNFLFQIFFLQFFFWKLKKNLKRYFYDGAHCQLMEINVRLWSSQSGNVAQSQLMELKVSWWSSKSADGALI